MSHVPAPESTESDAQPESGPATDRDAQDAREARFAAAIEQSPNGVWTVLTGPTRLAPSFARAAMQVADAELAPLVARVAELEALLTKVREDAEEYDAILSRQGDLLTRTANALRGDPPPLTSWSHHDVPERTQQVVASLTKVRALAAEHDYCSGCPTPWWLRAALAAAGPAVSDGECATSEACGCTCGHSDALHNVGLSGWCVVCECRAGTLPASPVVTPSATQPEPNVCPLCRHDHGRDSWPLCVCSCQWVAPSATDEGGA